MRACILVQILAAGVAKCRTRSTRRRVPKPVEPLAHHNLPASVLRTSTASPRTRLVEDTMSERRRTKPHQGWPRAWHHWRVRMSAYISQCSHVSILFLF
jgi:hypothetical protein